MVHGDSTCDEVPAIVGRRPANAGPGHRSERTRSSRRPDPAVCALEERSLATPHPLLADGRCLSQKSEAEPTRPRCVGSAANLGSSASRRLS